MAGSCKGTDAKASGEVLGISVTLSIRLIRVADSIVIRRKLTAACSFVHMLALLYGAGCGVGLLIQRTSKSIYKMMVYLFIRIE